MVDSSSAESRAGATVSGHPGSRGDGITRAELSPYTWPVPHQGDGKPDSVDPFRAWLTLSAMTRTHDHTDAQSTQRLISGGVIHAPRAANPASLSAGRLAATAPEIPASPCELIEAVQSRWRPVNAPWSPWSAPARRSTTATFCRATHRQQDECGKSWSLKLLIEGIDYFSFTRCLRC